jgi:hypothetical protein
MILVSILGRGSPIVLALSSTLSLIRVWAATGEHSVWPNTMVKAAPSFSSNRFTNGAGTVDPPEQIALTDDRSLVGKVGCSSMAISMVGTPIIALSVHRNMAPLFSFIGQGPVRAFPERLSSAPRLRWVTRASWICAWRECGQIVTATSTAVTGSSPKRSG